MSTPDSFNGLANKDFGITYYIASGFVLLCVTPFLLWFTTNIQRIFGHVVDTIRCIYLSTTQVFRTLYQWYTLWRELRQLQPTGQQHTNRNPDHQLPQTLLPSDKWITEIQQKWTPTPSEDHITTCQDLPQEYQVNTTELSFDIHFPNITQQRINTPPVVHNTASPPTQSVQPALGFTPAKVCHAESNPTLTVPQLLGIEPCREYTKTPLKTLDGPYVTQPKIFLPLAQEAKKLATELCKEEIASQWAGLLPEKLLQESFLGQLDAL